MAITYMRSFFLLAFVIVSTCCHTLAQSPSLDSTYYTLNLRLTQTQDKSSLMQIHGKLGQHLFLTNLDEARLHFVKAEMLSKDHGGKSDQYYYTQRVAAVEIIAGNYRKGLSILHDKLEEVQASGDSSLIYFHYYLGMGYQKLHAFPKALYHYEQVEIFSLKMNKPMMGIVVLGIISNLYAQQEKFELALVQKRIALQKTLPAKMPHILAFVYKDMGYLHLNLNQVDSAELYVHKAIALVEGNRNWDYVTGECKQVLSMVFLEKGDYLGAVDAAQSANEYAKRVGSQALELQVTLSLANIYHDIPDLETSLVHAYQALQLAEELNQRELLRDIYALLQSLYDKKNNIKQAYKYQALPTKWIRNSTTQKIISKRN